MNIDITSMFDSIKESLDNPKHNSSAYRDILKMEPGNTYLVRLIPNVKDPKATFFHYFHHGWNSTSTGQYVDSFCPTTFDERCIICENRFKLYKTKNEDDKKVAYNIRRMEKHMVNVYVISDPTNSENEGTVKVLRFGKRLHEKITEAIEGGDADEFGSKVFDLTENGCNFKIKVESTVEGTRKFANYNNSRFTAPGPIEGLTPQKIKTIYDSIFDLTKFVEPKSADEMKELLQEHLFSDFTIVAESSNKKSGTTNKLTAPKSTDTVAITDGDETIEPSINVPVEGEPSESTTTADSDKLKELLDDIENL